MLIDNDCPSVGHIHSLLSVLLLLLLSCPLLSLLCSSPGFSIYLYWLVLCCTLIDKPSISPSVCLCLVLYVCIIYCLSIHLSMYLSPTVSLLLRLAPSIAHSQTHIQVNKVSLDREGGNRRDVTLQPSQRQMEPISPTETGHLFIPIHCGVFMCVCNDSARPFTRLLVMQLNASLCLKAMSRACAFKHVFVH